MPNPATDKVRRFAVEEVKDEPVRGGRPIVVAYLVVDRTGFLSAERFEVERPPGRRPADRDVRAAATRALRRRRVLNLCEHQGHRIVFERCANCGVRL